jgi:hypothetical protein
MRPMIAATALSTLLGVAGCGLLVGGIGSPYLEPGDAMVQDVVRDATKDASVLRDAPAHSASDGGGKAPAEGDASWSPADLSGLVLWLDAHVGLAYVPATSLVSWRDQSTYHNNAIGSASIDPAAINGHPAVHFDGDFDSSTAYLNVVDAPSLRWGTVSFTVAAVLEHTTPTDAPHRVGAIYSKQWESEIPFTGVSLWGNTYTNSGLLAELANSGDAEVSTSRTGFNDGVPFVVVLYRAAASSEPDGGASMTLFVNGADAGAGTGRAYGIDVTTTAYPARIGGTQYGQNLRGDIAEVVALRGSRTDKELQQLQTYLMNKYAISSAVKLR